jgi:hypothetical protein
MGVKFKISTTLQQGRVDAKVGFEGGHHQLPDAFNPCQIVVAVLKGDPAEESAEAAREGARGRAQPSRFGQNLQQSGNQA